MAVIPGERDGFISSEDATFGGPTPGSLGSITPVTWTNFICRSRHPVAAFFHIAFKVRRAAGPGVAPLPCAPHPCPR